jgi:hypothetical protein
MKVIKALLLVLALSVCAFAGDMECGRTGEMENDKTGDMHAGRTSTIDPITEVALQLVQSVLPLF